MTEAGRMREEEEEEEEEGKTGWQLRRCVQRWNQTVKHIRSAAKVKTQSTCSFIKQRLSPFDDIHLCIKEEDNLIKIFFWVVSYRAHCLITQFKGRRVASDPFQAELIQVVRTHWHQKHNCFLPPSDIYCTSLLSVFCYFETALTLTPCCSCRKLS